MQNCLANKRTLSFACQSTSVECNCKKFQTKQKDLKSQHKCRHCSQECLSGTSSLNISSIKIYALIRDPQNKESHLYILSIHQYKTQAHPNHTDIDKHSNIT